MQELADTLDGGIARTQNLALRQATFEVNRGVDLAKNITSNLASSNEKLRKITNNTDEVFGDLSLSHGLIGDLERRRNRDRLLCKVITIAGLSVLGVLIVGKFMLR